MKNEFTTEDLTTTYLRGVDLDSLTPEELAEISYNIYKGGEKLELRLLEEMNIAEL